MLQVVDEIDDAVGAVRLWGVGMAAELGMKVSAAFGLAGVCAAIWLREESLLVYSAAAMLSIGAALKRHRFQP